MNEDTGKVQPAEVSVEPNETGGKAQEVAIFAGGCFWCMVEPLKTSRAFFPSCRGILGNSPESDV